MTEETQEPPATPKPPSEPEWPAHFPPGCPPQDAANLGGVVYLLVAADPPAVADMECAIDRGTHIDKPECLRASLSCARGSDHLQELRGRIKRLRNHRVASAQVQADHGKIKQTGAPGHYSMWLRAKYLKIGHTLFRVLP